MTTRQFTNNAKVGTVLQRKLDSAIGICLVEGDMPYAVFEDGSQHSMYVDQVNIIGEAESLRGFHLKPSTTVEVSRLYNIGFFDSVFKHREFKVLDSYFENKKIQDIIIS